MRERNVRESLAAMSYFEAKPGRWLKPFAYVCFSFNEETLVWENWFRPANSSDPQIWDSHDLDLDISVSGSYIEQIKYWECSAKTDIFIPSCFELNRIVL